MSLSLSAFAVKQPDYEVLKGMKSFYAQKGGQVREVNLDELDRDPYKFTLLQDGEWSVAEFSEMGLTPPLLKYLSERFESQVIAVDVRETVGYEHFSVMDNGKIIKLFTMMDEEKESEGINFDEVLAKLKTSPMFNYAGEWEVEDIKYNAATNLSAVDADYNVMKAVISSDVEVKAYEISGVKLRHMGDDGKSFFLDLVYLP